MIKTPLLKRPFLWLPPLVIFLSGCSIIKTRYEYIPPKTSEGSTCIQECERMKSQCKIEEGLRADKEQNRIDIAYEECREWRLSRWSKALCRHETVYPDYSECNKNYDQCFEQCGGKIIKKGASPD